MHRRAPERRDLGMGGQEREKRLRRSVESPSTPQLSGGEVHVCEESTQGWINNHLKDRTILEGQEEFLFLIIKMGKACNTHHNI